MVEIIKNTKGGNKLMCEYCEESKNRKDIDDNGEIKVRLNEQMGNNLEIDYYYYGAKVGRYIPIAYCPMCRKISK